MELYYLYLCLTGQSFKLLLTVGSWVQYILFVFSSFLRNLNQRRHF